MSFSTPAGTIEGISKASISTAKYALCFQCERFQTTSVSKLITIIEHRKNYLLVWVVNYSRSKQEEELYQLTADILEKIKGGVNAKPRYTTLIQGDLKPLT